MNHDRTYHPFRCVSAPRLRDADGSMRQAPCRSAGYAATHPVQPLKGLPGTRATDVSYRASVPAGHAGRGVALSYRALAPGGAGFCYRICTGTSESRPTAHYSLLTANSSYTFSAKEKDSETGLSYFGSRYYSSDLSVWLSVDPMADKYPSMSPYVYCANNPVRLVDPNGEEYDGYEGSNGQYKWFDNHSEQSFSENGVKWTKVTENKSDWDEATAIRDANIEGLVSLGFDRSQAERDVRLYEGDNPLFTKESQLNNANNYTGSWESSYNSGGETAYESPEIKNTGYSLKYYPTKNGGKKALGIVKRGILGHGLEGVLELLERKVYKQKADSDPLYDMHYRNARGLLKALRNSKIDISAPPTIYSNYHRSGGAKLP